MDLDTLTLVTAGGLVAAAAIGAAYVIGHRAGRRAGARGAVAEANRGLAELWHYQRILNDSASEIDGLLDGSFPLTETDRDELLAARSAAYPFADRLPPDVRWVVEAPSLPDIADPTVDLVDVAFAYMKMSEAIRGALERRSPERRSGSDVPAERQAMRTSKR